MLAPALALSLGAFAFTAHAASAADNFPNRPIHIQIGFSPGGSTDVPFRVFAENAAKILGQPVIIENKPGAGGVLPAQSMQNAKPDGYTLAQVPLPVFRMKYVTKVNWDPVEDLDYVIGLAGYTFGVVVPADSPIQDMQGYLDYAKQNPGKLTYGTPGAMTTLHVTMEMLASQAGVELTHVPYKGNSESLQAVVGKHVMSVADTPGWAPFVQDGKLRLLSTWGDERSEKFPDAPTLKELGLGIVQASPFGLVAPKGTDPQIIQTLHDAFKQAMEQPNFVEVLDRFDMKPNYMSSADYAAWAAETAKSEAAVLEGLGMTVQ
ncbi:tripartite tricarboxylate transporter substrate binding protein [Verticiella sediminum]|uniref:Tripartite tricarboxylate transporter substrate binding protein n=2 Tax=Verticiella sediminum TaxID=1247510 RepID=A0A556B1L9_9BURK|nr:tripartite tricarboxylate transporter substrate-binding protein [Verticiella sediminum]TSH99054.1 tripartite tricarboxylate transporter substrate binding protein [Verticiella sediminum]